MADGNIIEATLTAGGLVCTKPCVYIIKITCPKNIVWRYVGRTWSSNGTGTSSPYARLALHLIERSWNTYSCFWRNCRPHRLSRDALKNASVTFRAVLVSAKKVAAAETWLRWKWQQKDGCGLLNGPLTHDPEVILDKTIEEALQPLLAD